MKTKIKRHSRAVISVILAVCMLVSCMTVGLIATDAAKLTGDETVGTTGYGFKGSWDGWQEHATGSTLTLEAGTYEFVCYHDGTQYRTGGTVTANPTGTVRFNVPQSNANMKLVVETAGSYTVYVSYQSSSAVEFSIVGNASPSPANDDWYIYGNQFGGWSFTAANPTEITHLNKDDSGYYYVIHTVGEGDDWYAFYNKNGQEHYRPSSSTQLDPATHNTQASGVAGTIGWSSYSFGLHKNNEDGTKLKVWWDATNKTTWITPHTYTVKADTVTGGSIKVDGKSEVTGLSPDNSATVALVATPDTGYHFAGWVSNNHLTFADENSATTTATVTGDATATAIFEKDKYTVSCATVANVNLSADPVGQVEWGETVTVTAECTSNLHEITEVSYNDGTKHVLTAPYTFTMPKANVTVSAVATKLEAYALNFTAAGEGAGYISAGKKHTTLSATPEIEQSYNSGDEVLKNTVVNLCAIPVKNNKFMGWYTDSSFTTSATGSYGITDGTQANIEVTIPQGAVNLYARFEPETPAYTDPRDGEAGFVKIFIRKDMCGTNKYNYASVWNRGSNYNQDWIAIDTTKEYSVDNDSGTTCYLIKVPVASNQTNVSARLAEKNDWSNTGTIANEDHNLTSMSEGNSYYVYSEYGELKKPKWAAMDYDTETHDADGYTEDTYPVFLDVVHPEYDTSGGSSTYAPAYVNKNTNFTVNHTADVTHKINMSLVGYTGDGGVKKTTSTLLTMPASYNASNKVTVSYIEKTKYTVTYRSNDASKGTVAATVDGVSINSGDKVYEDKTVVFSAAATTDHHFNKWSGAATDRTTPKSIEVTGDIDITGNFRDHGYQLDVGGTKYVMDEIAGGLYICNDKLLAKNATFKIYRESDAKYTNQTLTIDNTGRSSKVTVTEEWETSPTSNIALKNDSPFTSTADTYIVFNPATGDVWATKSNALHSVTLGSVQYGSMTATYGTATIGEGDTLDNVLTGDEVSININPDTDLNSSLPYVCGTMTGTYDGGTASITGAFNSRTMTMPDADTTVSATMRVADMTNVYFNNYYSKYPMVSAYAWFGNPDQTNTTLEPLGMWSGKTMTKLTNTNTWEIKVPEGTPYIIFVGKGGNTNSDENNYYHITIPWENNPPMYTAGSIPASPTTNGTWGTYVERTNEIEVTKDTDTMSSNTLYTSLTATMYDYYVDNEYGTGVTNWISGIKSGDYSENGQATNNSYTKLNDAIDMYSYNNSVTYPMYFGNFYGIQDNSTNDIIKVKSDNSTRKGQKYTNWKYIVNNSNGLSTNSSGTDTGVKRNAVTGLSGQTLDSYSTIFHYKSGATNENGAPMAMFDEDFLSGENIHKTNLATILRSNSFPVRKTKVTGTQYDYYEYDSTGGTDNAYITDINKTTHKAKMSYYNDKKVHAGKVGGAYGDYGFFPFDYNTMSDQTNSDSKIAHDLGFGMKLEIPFTINKYGTLEGTSDGTAQEFNFSGDDDLWVYIDGHLVLDLGGDHNATTGKIDFKAMTATANDKQPVNATTPAVRNGAFGGSGADKWFDNTKENQIHTMTIYYVERGMWDSNLKFGFSFHPIPNLLTVDKKVRTHFVNSGFFETTAYNTAYKSDGLTPYLNDQGHEITQFEHTYQADYQTTDTGVTPSSDPMKKEAFTINQSSSGLATARADGSILYTIGDVDTTVPEGSQGDNHSFSYQLYNDQGANFIQQYDGGQTVTLSETIPGTSLYHYYANGDKLPDGTTNSAFAFTDIAHLDKNGKENALAYTSNNGVYTLTMPTGSAGSELDDIRVRARFTNQMKTHNLTLTKKVNDGNPNEAFTFVVKFKFGDYDYQPYPLFCVVDGANTQMSNDGEIVVRDSHSVTIPNIPENVSIQVSEEISGLSNYAFNEMVITDANSDEVPITGSVVNGKQFTMGTSNITATVRNTKSELHVSHELKAGSEVNGTCYVWAEVLGAGDAVVETIGNQTNTDEISIPSSYVKYNNETNKLKIYLKTEIADTANVCDFYEQIFETLNAFTTGDNLDLGATVAVTPISSGTATATITFPIKNVFDQTQAQRTSTLPFYSDLKNSYSFTITKTLAEYTENEGFPFTIYTSTNGTDWAFLAGKAYTSSTPANASSTSQTGNLQIHQNEKVTFSNIPANTYVKIVESGAVKDYLYDSATAKKHADGSTDAANFSDDPTNKTVIFQLTDDDVDVTVNNKRQEYRWIIKFTYDSRLWGEQGYQAEGTFTKSQLDTYTTYGDVTDKSSGTTVKGIAFKNAQSRAEFVQKYAPHEDNYRKTVEWNFNTFTEDFHFNNKQISMGQKAQPGQEELLTVRYDFPCKMSHTGAGSVPDPASMYQGFPEAASETKTSLTLNNVSYMNWYCLNDAKIVNGVANKEPIFVSAPEAIIDTTNGRDHAVVKYFKYWSVKTMNADPEKCIEYTRCYNREFNYAFYQNSIVTPVYVEANGPFNHNEMARTAVADTPASITFLETSRNVWNNSDCGSAKNVWNNQGLYSNYGDRIFVDFVLDLHYVKNGQNIQLNTISAADRSKYHAGLLIQKLDELEFKSGSTEYETDGSYYAGLEKYKNADGKNEAMTALTGNTATSANNYFNSKISVDKFDNKNELEYYYHFANISQAQDYRTRTTYKNYVYRAYTYLYVDGEATKIISDPVYFTMYDMASIENDYERAINK